ncbi:MAG: cytochrome c biogenesis protein ResB [Streptosporangiales bacterium]|nr:cytochrome c biogenesis protein ResB [Streptosporangiales bacterium]
MRTALILLFLLAVAAAPGSYLPQRGVDPGKVTAYFQQHKELAPILDRLSLFDVYSAPWFAAIYLLLFISLAGCVIPRLGQHTRALRARPPAAPRNLGRLPYHATFTVTDAPADVLAAARATLRGYRADGTETTVAAEKGYARETGNLLFHFALLALLLAVGAGAAFGYRGNVLLNEGSGFANTVAAYDRYIPGSLVGAGDLQPFSAHLEDFAATYVTEGRTRGQASSFTAKLRYRESPESPERPYDLRVNHPLEVDGARLYLLGHGYAPVFKVTDGNGEVPWDGPVPFLPRDQITYTSEGVVKAPDAGPDQLAFLGYFFPTSGKTADGKLTSTFPAPDDPTVTLLSFKGDLGLDAGVPQSVYAIEAKGLTKIGKSTTLRPGETLELPDGAGSITFTGYREWASLQITSDPGRTWALVAAVLAIAGLLPALTVRRRRVWVRARAGDGGRTVVEVGGLTKADGDGFAPEFDEITEGLRARLRAAPPSVGDKE